MILWEPVASGMGLSSSSTVIPWKLILIYYGLVLLAFGSLVYQFCCPAEIKHFSNAEDYMSAMLPQMTPRLQMKIDTDLNKYESAATDYSKFKKQRSQSQSTTDPVGAARQRRDDGFNRLLLELHYRTLDGCRVIARASSATLYGIGFCLLAIPSARVFFRVTLVATRALISW